jgi:hypothetical protein
LDQERKRGRESYLTQLAEVTPDPFSFPSHDTERGTGRVYCTSLAVLSLSVKYHYLPIYQR